jgi:uncharacterized protein (DUF302 family)
MDICKVGFSAVMLVLALAMGIAAAPGAWAAEEVGVYVNVVETATGEFDAVVGAAEAALTGAGWDVLASFESGVEPECGKLRAHVIVVNNAEYAAQVVSHGPEGVFAIPLRVGVYQDERGTHVEVLNPRSLNRTVLGDAVETSSASDALSTLTTALQGAIAGKQVARQLGQIRTKGYVGGMGGGEFMSKVEVIHEGGEYASVAASVRAGLEANQQGWKLVYTLEPAPGVTLFGITKSPTEARAFGIAGDAREDDDYVCPGLDHAAAFPIGVAVYSKDGKTVVATLDEMYRMKVYFEDAGNWAFMKNMTMPGAIFDEIEAAALSKLVK